MWEQQPVGLGLNLSLVTKLYQKAQLEQGPCFPEENELYFLKPAVTSNLRGRRLVINFPKIVCEQVAKELPGYSLSILVSL